MFTREHAFAEFPHYVFRDAFYVKETGTDNADIHTRENIALISIQYPELCF